MARVLVRADAPASDQVAIGEESRSDDCDTRCLVENRAVGSNLHGGYVSVFSHFQCMGKRLGDDFTTRTLKNREFRQTSETQ